MKRPDMRDYFLAKIDHHVRGMMSPLQVRIPHDVTHVLGDVTDPVITVTTRDGTMFQWSGGRFSSRKVHGTYAPLMPKPLEDRDNG